MSDYLAKTELINKDTTRIKSTFTQQKVDNY